MPQVLRSFQGRLRLVDPSRDQEDVLHDLREALATVSQVGELALWEVQPEGWSAPCLGNDDSNVELLRILTELKSRAASEGVVATRLLDAQRCVHLGLAVTIAGPPDATGAVSTAGVVAATFRLQGESDDWFILLLEEVAGLLRAAQFANGRRCVVEELSGIAGVLELAAKVEAAESLAVALQVLVEEASAYLGATVAVGLVTRPDSNCSLRAISGVAGVDRNSPRSRAIAAALDEVLTQGRVTIYPAQSTIERQGLLTHQQLVRDGHCQGVVGVPLRETQGELRGAWICLGDETLVHNSAALRFLRACEFRLGDTLRLLRRAEKPWWRRWLAQATRRLGISASRLIVAGAVLFAGVMCIPWWHRLHCDCTLQPVTRRFVASPFDATLERAFVEPGQIVAEGELLAKLDAREITWEQAGLDTEQQRAAKERDTRLAKHEIAASQLARYDYEKLELRRRLLAHRSEHLEIRSPIAGLVIVGDWKKSEGVPLTTGKNLYEIAPLGRMLVEVAISERDIAHAAVGQTVDVTLEGFPGEHWSGKLVRMHPRSEIRDEANVFIGEVELENPDGRLFPGMQGQARIASGTRPVGWLLFHRLAEACLLYTGW